MKVSELMSRDVQVARPDEAIQSVAQRMKEADIGSLPVCDGDRILGMVTDRDITIRAVAEGRSLQSPVSEVMTPEIEYVFDDDDAGDAADRMADAQVRRLPVLSREKRLVGIVALGDLTGHVRDKTAGQTLEEISEPSRLA
jgi:CBS domain-containing protein